MICTADGKPIEITTGNLLTSEYNPTLKVKKLSEDATTPTRAHSTDAGLDIYATTSTQIFPGETKALGTGVALSVPTGFVGLLCDRSSMGLRGFKVLGGVVDAGYTGEVKVILHNLGPFTQHIGANDKIAQLLLIPVNTAAVEVVESLNTSARNTSGFGSSGR